MGIIDLFGSIWQLDSKNIPHFDGIYGLRFGFSSYKTCFWVGGPLEVGTYQKKNKNLTQSLENPLPNPLVLVHQCHTSSLENHLVNLCFQKDTFVKTYKIYIYMHEFMKNISIF